MLATRLSVHCEFTKIESNIAAEVELKIPPKDL